MRQLKCQNIEFCSTGDLHYYLGCLVGRLMTGADFKQATSHFVAFLDFFFMERCVKHIFYLFLKCSSVVVAEMSLSNKSEYLH